MSAIDRLLALSNPFDASPQAEDVFIAAMREAVDWHFDNSEAYRNLCQLQAFDCATWVDILAIPHVYVNAFKARELLSIPKSEVVLNLSSSGTTGQKSQIFFDRISLDRALRMVEAVFDAMGFVDRGQEVNYLLFAYDPAEAAKVGTAFTDDNLTTYTKRRAVHYALRWSPETSKFEFGLEEAYAVLQGYAKEEFPTRILGFPAFLDRLVDYHHRRTKSPLRLAPGSLVHTGGGWKSSEHEAIDKTVFRNKVSLALGVDQKHIRDGYGLVEHSVPYIECEEHRFHVPVYSRAVARDVVTLAPLESGAVGFLELLTPYIRSMPAHALLTSDLAATHVGCACGRMTRWIEFMGRAGVKKNKGCAITALEALPS